MTDNDPISPMFLYTNATSKMTRFRHLMKGIVKLQIVVIENEGLRKLVDNPEDEIQEYKKVSPMKEPIHCDCERNLCND